MGTRGPIGKRSDQRRRRNKQPENEPALVTAIGQSEVKPPAEDRAWHPYAKQWFRSLKRSGQAKFYQDSDWQEARMVAFLISNEFNRESGPRSGMMDTIFARGDSLMTTEGARRRLRIELVNAHNHDHDKEATVSMMEEYRADLA